MPRIKKDENIEEVKEGLKEINIKEEVKKTETTIADQLMRQNVKHAKQYKDGESQIKKIEVRTEKGDIKIKEIEEIIFKNGVVKQRLLRTYKK